MNNVTGSLSDGLSYGLGYGWTDVAGKKHSISLGRAFAEGIGVGLGAGAIYVTGSALTNGAMGLFD